MRALADTSVFVAQEQGRALNGDVPDELVVSVITVAELRFGVLMATSLQARSQRLQTLHVVESLEPLPVDDNVATSWAHLVATLRASGRKAPVNDSWIAATALAHRLPVVTQDADYDAISDLAVIRL